MKSRILAILLLLGGASYGYAACDTVIGVSNWNACSINDTTGVPDCWGADNSSLTSGATTSALTTLDGGDETMCGVKTDGSLVCWGADGYEIVTEVPAGTTYDYVSPGTQTACARKTDNSIACWGANEETCATNADCAAVGAGTCSAGNCSFGATWIAPSGSFTQFRGDSDTYCGVKTDGSLMCWGVDYADGVMTEPAGTNYALVDATADHACAIETDDTVTCWGANADGQSTAPAGTFLDLAVVLGTSCGIQADGDIECWGSDVCSLLTDAPVGTFTRIAGSACNMCAVKNDGDVVCWGDDTGGIVTASAGSECALSAAAAYIVTFVGS